MTIVLIGPGRAGMALSLASTEAGHQVVAVMARALDVAAIAASKIGAEAVTWGSDVPLADVAFIAVRDDAIATVAKDLTGHLDRVGAAVHLSGLHPVGALAPLANAGLQTGSFHPLQTLPTPEAGASRLAGAWMAVTAPEPLRQSLFELAESIGAVPFDLTDDKKPLYHAAAAAAANFSLIPLAMAHDLLAAAGVPFEAARPLVEAVVANAFDLGPRYALTGPVSRGDVTTVVAQLDAVRTEVPEWADDFAALIAILARLSDRTEEFREVLE